MAKGQQKAKASTQEHLDVDDIIDDLVILKTGWVALVMSTTAVNFDLLSEAEQDATIYAYGAFLNSLSFPLEVLVRSKKADITSYFQSLEEAESTQPNPDLKRQIQKYKDFIQSTVQQRTVLDKKFYLIINFSPLEMGIHGIGAKKGSQSRSKAELLTNAKTALLPKRDHIFKQTARLGLTTKQLTTQELIELFYDIYNPAPTGTQRVILDTASYTTPLVEPALEVPTPAPAGIVGVSVPQPTIPAASVADTPPQEAELRPVSAMGGNQMQQQAPEPIVTGQGRVPSSGMPGPVGQTEALKGLQEATSRAAQVLNKPQAVSVNPSSPTAPNAQNVSGQSSNKYEINVKDGGS